MGRYWRIFLLGLAAIFGSAVSSSIAFANVGLAFDSASLSFGNASLTGSKTLTLEVWDTTSDDIEINLFAFTGADAADFSVTSDSITPFVVRADSGNNIKIFVTFSPKANGPRTGFLELETSNGMVYIPLTGIGGEKSGLALSDSAIDFGLLGPGAERDTVIELYSTGPDSASIAAIVIASVDGSFQAQTVSGIQTPFMLAPGDSVAIDVSFQGISPVGEKDAQLIVYGATLNTPQCDLSGDVELGDFDILPSATIDFGTMYAGQVRDTTVSIENPSDVPIVINNLSIAPYGDDFSLLIPNDTQLAIPPGGEVQLTVRANPGLNTSHTASLYAVSQSADTTYRSVTLLVSVVQPSLTNPPNQTISYFCAVSAPMELTLPISDTGSGSIVITNFISNDTSVVVSTNPSVPDTLVAGENQSLTVEFDPSKVVDSQLVIEGLGGEQIMISDSVFLQPKVSLATMSISLLGVQSGTQANFDVSPATALTPFGIDTIIVHISVEDTNVASVSTPDIKLSPGIANATITSIQPEPGGYAVTIASPLTIVLAAGSPLLTVGFSRFVSIADSSNVFVAIETPEKSGCLDWALDSSVVQGATVCGSTIMQDAMAGVPIILTANLRENPVTDGDADVVISSNVAISQARFSLTNAIGESVSDGTLDLAAGQNYKEFSLSRLPSGAYILRIFTMDGFSTGLRLLKLN